MEDSRRLLEEMHNIIEKNNKDEQRLQQACSCSGSFDVSGLPLTNVELTLFGSTTPTTGIFQTTSGSFCTDCSFGGSFSFQFIPDGEADSIQFNSTSITGVVCPAPDGACPSSTSSLQVTGTGDFLIGGQLPITLCNFTLTLCEGSTCAFSLAILSSTNTDIFVTELITVPCNSIQINPCISSCACNGTLIYFGFDSNTRGDISIQATICPNCEGLQSSMLTAQLSRAPGNNYSFTATTFDSVTCSSTNALVCTGSGTFNNIPGTPFMLQLFIIQGTFPVPAFIFQASNVISTALVFPSGTGIINLCSNAGK